MIQIKPPSVIPQDRSITVYANLASSYDTFADLLGAPPLKWWQRLYIRLRWGRKIRKANIQAARSVSKPRMTFQYLYGIDPFDLTEDENAEEEN